MKKISRLFLLAIFTVSIASCAQNTSTNSKNQKVSLLSAIAFNVEMINMKEKQIIDVRTPEEFHSGYINGAKNLNIYDHDFEQKLKELDKSKPVFVYCKGGGRSADAAEQLKSLGFSDIYDMKGGIMAWGNRNLPVVTTTTKAPDLFTRKDYDTLLAQGLPVLIDYYATWCAPCKKMEPILDKLSKEFEGKIVIKRINVDEASALVKELTIENIPVITTHKQGNELKHVNGFQLEDQMRSMINELLH